MPHLDLFTIKMATLVTVLAVSLWTSLACRINRSAVGMSQFSLGLLGICIGSVLGVSRLVVAGDGIVIAGNVVTVGGMILVAQGIRAFRALPPLKPTTLAVFSAIIAAPFLYWLYVHEDFSMRVGVISAAMALLAVDCTVSLARRPHADDRVTVWPVALAFAFTGAFLGVRTVAAFTNHYGANFLAPAPIDIPLSLCANVAFVGCAFGMLLASNTQMRQMAEKMASFDPLTGLPNRRVLLDRLLEAERRAIETDRQLGVIYLDLDRFKLVNDTLGHAAGDELLRKVSAAMTPMLGPGDCLARVGGDEFVVVVEDLEGRAELATLADRIRMSVESQKIPGPSGEAVRVSCGIALFPDDGNTAHDVMREADTAMYLTKRQRRLLTQLIEHQIV